MVDSNGVNYVSNDWSAQYVVTKDDQLIIDMINSFSSDTDRFDYNDDGIVDIADGELFQRVEPVVTIEYRLACFNGAAQ